MGFDFCLARRSNIDVYAQGASSSSYTFLPREVCFGGTLARLLDYFIQQEYGAKKALLNRQIILRFLYKASEVVSFMSILRNTDL